MDLKNDRERVKVQYFEEEKNHASNKIDTNMEQLNVLSYFDFFLVGGGLVFFSFRNAIDNNWYICKEIDWWFFSPKNAYYFCLYV